MGISVHSYERRSQHHQPYNNIIIMKFLVGICLVACAVAVPINRTPEELVKAHIAAVRGEQPDFLNNLMGAKVQGTPLYQAAATTPYLTDASYVAAPMPYIGHTPLVAAAQPYIANSYAVAEAKPYLADAAYVAAAKPYLADTPAVAAAKPYLA